MKFPVLFIGKQDGVEFCGTEEMLSTSTVVTLKRGNLLENSIVDCDGLVYRPISVDRVRILRFNIFLNHWLRIRYEFNMPPTQMSLTNLKEIVTHRILEDRDLFEETGDVSTLLNLIAKATTFRELISLLKNG